MTAFFVDSASVEVVVDCGGDGGVGEHERLGEIIVLGGEEEEEVGEDGDDGGNDESLLTRVMKAI